MKAWSRFKRWRRLRQARREQSSNPLREFLYLDDTAVYSLYASRFGPVPKEYTDSYQRTSNAELSAEVGVDAKPTTAKLSPKLSAGSSTNRSVVSNANIQATFKEWLDFERDHFVLQPTPDGIAVPTFKGPGEIQRVRREDASQSWTLEPDQIKRGALLEVEIELSSANVFKLSSIFTEMIELARENPTFFGAQLGDISQVETVTKVADRFLVGLIPLECRVVDYVLFPIEGRDWIVHKGIVSQFPADVRDTAKPLYLTGVSEARYFWKDIRRVLFSAARVRAVVRIDKPFAAGKWNAVKLIDLLREVNPEIARTVETGFDGLSPRAVEAGANAASNDLEMKKSALRRYATELALLDRDEATARSVPADLDPMISAAAPAMVDPEGTFQAFGVVSDRMREEYGNYFSSEQSAGIREAIVLSLTRPADDPSSGSTTGNSSSKAAPRFLEVEFVAIYW